MGCDLRHYSQQFFCLRLYKYFLEEFHQSLSCHSWYLVFFFSLVSNQQNSLRYVSFVSCHFPFKVYKVITYHQRQYDYLLGTLTVIIILMMSFFYWLMCDPYYLCFMIIGSLSSHLLIFEEKVLIHTRMSYSPTFGLCLFSIVNFLSFKVLDFFILQIYSNFLLVSLYCASLVSFLTFFLLGVIVDNQ